MQDFWVFGYASLMWKPGFEFAERKRARLIGFHRALCIRSFEHRGTRERPGLVMGLDRGGSCVGIAFRIEGRNHDEVMAYLRQRELVTHVYKEHRGTLRFRDGEVTKAVAYVADRNHEQYAPRMSVDEAVSRVCGAVGAAGPNEEYVLNTVAHIEEMGIRDHWLEEVAAGIRADMERRGLTAG